MRFQPDGLVMCFILTCVLYNVVIEGRLTPLLRWTVPTSAATCKPPLQKIVQPSITLSSLHNCKSSTYPHLMSLSLIDCKLSSLSFCTILSLNKLLFTVLACFYHLLRLCIYTPLYFICTASWKFMALKNKL